MTMAPLDTVGVSASGESTQTKSASVDGGWERLFGPLDCVMWIS
jgi:hypothetical protein